MKRLVLLSLILLLPAFVFAQVQLTVGSTTQPMRGEGLTETAGNVSFQVPSGGAAGTIATNSTITLFYNAPISVVPGSTVSSASGPAFSNNGVVAATGGLPLVACTAAGVPAGCNYFVTISGNSLIITFPAAAGLAVGVNQGFIVSNVRVNATGQSTVTATILQTSPAGSAITFTPNTPQTVGLVTTPSLGATVGAPSSSSVTSFVAAPFTPVLGCNGTAFPAAGATKTRLIISEKEPAAFTTKVDETNFTPLDAQVTNGTIIQLTLHNVPFGASVLITPQVVNQGSGQGSSLAAQVAGVNTAAIIAASSTVTLSTTAGVNLIAAAAAPSATTVTGTGADQVFFIIFTADNLNSLEDLVVALDTTVTAGTAPLATGITADLSLVPGSSTSSSAPLYPVVRFNTLALMTGQSIGTISGCNSALLFPYVVTGVGGFDTGIAIANTTLDPFTTTATLPLHAVAQNGACTLTGFNTADPTGTSTGNVVTPAAAAVTFTTPVINAGGSWTSSLSTTGNFSTGFIGYMFAQCNFLNAHGMGFIVNGLGGTVTIAQGFVALVVPTSLAPVPISTGGTIQFPVSRAVNGTAESLGQ